MQPLRIRAVFVKEVRDALRDRRTIFATIFVPILLWPVMLLGLAEATQLAQNRIRSETYTVAVPPESLSFFERIADEEEEAPAPKKRSRAKAKKDEVEDEPVAEKPAPKKKPATKRAASKGKFAKPKSKKASKDDALEDADGGYPPRPAR